MHLRDKLGYFRKILIVSIINSNLNIATILYKSHNINHTAQITILPNKSQQQFTINFNQPNPFTAQPKPNVVIRHGLQLATKTNDEARWRSVEVDIDRCQKPSLSSLKINATPIWPTSLVLVEDGVSLGEREGLTWRETK